MYDEIKCDILIIGSGAAGLRSAIEAHDRGVKDIIVLGKCKKGDAHTVLATGGINAALGTMDPKDNYLVHAADTMQEGWFLADYRQVLTLCRNAPDAIEELSEWGVRFHKEKDGRLTQRFFGAHTYRRTCFFGDQTGKEMMRVLVNQVRKRRIKFLGNIFIVSLLRNGGSIAGAIGIDFGRGRIVVFNSKSVILAAGGYTKIYSRSSSRGYENHGDGAALAFDIGISLVDMEMVQFHPTGMVYPKSVVGTLVTEAVRGEGGILLNSKMERFMKKYDPKNMELGPRDFVSRCVYTEIKDGRGTKHGGVWLDITMLPKSKILNRLPKMYSQFKKFDNIDISKDKMEVAPTAHYTMGGVDVSLDGETKVKGLYAVGETVGQIHGANRLGGNSLLETIVFGKIVGENAARFAKSGKLREINKNELYDKINYINVFHGKGKADPGLMRERLQKTLWAYVGIVRNRKSLEEGNAEIEKIKAEFHSLKVRKGLKNNKNLRIAIETDKMFEICEAVIKSALLRRESRGAHYRSDYPKTLDKWHVNIIASKTNGRVKLVTRRIPKIDDKLKKEIEMLGEVKVNRSFE
jgi:succinate dehydrogenase / fumarate reductase flavoprotein subunit